MLAFLNRLVSCKSEASLPKEDDAVPPPPATAVIVPPATEDTGLLLARARVSIGPGFVSHADASRVPKQPFLSHDTNLQAAAPGASATTVAAGQVKLQVVEATSSAKSAKSEYMAYWAPDTFIDSALASKAQFEASLKLPSGARCMMERAARGFKIPTGYARSEYMAYWAPASFAESALRSREDFEATKSLPEGERCMLERACRKQMEAVLIGKAVAEQVLANVKSVTLAAA